jgi:hypothetical protein
MAIHSIAMESRYFMLFKSVINVGNFEDRYVKKINTKKPATFQ